MSTIARYKLGTQLEVFDNDKNLKSLLQYYKLYDYDLSTSQSNPERIAKFKELSELLITNESYISSNDINDLYDEFYKMSEMAAIFEINQLQEDLYKQILFTFKYGLVRYFFKENWEKFLPNYDAELIKDKERFNLFQSALMHEYDKFSSIIEELYNLQDIDNVPDEYLKYLIQITGFERDERSRAIVDENKFRELAKNIIEVYRIKGTNYSFELFFNFLGSQVTLEELWFDKRFYFGISENPYTGAKRDDDFSKYLTPIKPTEYVPAGMTNPYTIEDDSLTDILGSENFAQLITDGYSVSQLLGEAESDLEYTYTYFKTNLVRYEISTLSGGGTEEEFSSEKESAIKAYVEFLTPIFLDEKVVITAKVFLDTIVLILQDGGEELISTQTHSEPISYEFYETRYMPINDSLLNYTNYRGNQVAGLTDYNLTVVDSTEYNSNIVYLMSNSDIASYDHSTDMWHSFADTPIGYEDYTNKYLNYENVVRIFPYNDGSINWLLAISETGKIAAYDLEWIAYDDSVGPILNIDSTFENIIEYNNNLIVVYNNEIHSYNGTSWDDAFSGTLTHNTYSITIYNDGSNDHIIFAGDNGDISSWEVSTSTLHSANGSTGIHYDGLCNGENIKQSLHFVDSGTYWLINISSTGKVASYDGSSWHDYNSNTGISENTGILGSNEAIVYDDSNTTFIATADDYGQISAYNVDEESFYSTKSDSLITDSKTAEGFYYVAGTTANSIWTAPDPTSTWTEVQDLDGTINDIIYENNYYIAGTAGGSIYTTTDPTSTWVQNDTIFDGDVSSLTYGNGYYVAGTNSNSIWTATDPTDTWTEIQDLNGIPYELIYGNGYYVASTGSLRIWTATDPTDTWTEIQVLDGVANSLIYANGYYVAGTTANSIWTATDPTDTWTEIQDLDGSVSSLTYGNGYYIAGTTANSIWVATDPTGTWTEIQDLDGSVSSLTYGNGYYIAGTHASSIWVATDPTGTWTEIQDLDGFVYSITFSLGEINSFLHTFANDLFIANADNLSTYLETDNVIIPQKIDIVPSSFSKNTSHLFIGDATDTSNTGKVYWYEFTSNTWSSVSSQAGYNVGEKFGFSIYATDLYVVVGAPEYNTNVGKVYLFDNTMTLLDSIEGIYTGNFGYSVRIYGTTVIIGEPNYNTDQGAIYTYEISSNSLFPKTAYYGSNNANLGFDVELYTSGYLASEPNYNSNQGAVHLLTSGDGISYMQTVDLPASTNELGRKAKISSSHATLINEKSNNTVHVYDYNSSLSRFESKSTLDDSQFSYDEFGSGIAIDDTDVIIGIQRKDKENYLAYDAGSGLTGTSNITSGINDMDYYADYSYIVFAGVNGLVDRMDPTTSIITALDDGTAMGNADIQAVIENGNKIIVAGNSGRVASYDGSNWENYDGTGIGIGPYNNSEVIGSNTINVIAEYNGYYMFAGNGGRVGSYSDADVQTISGGDADDTYTDTLSGGDADDTFTDTYDGGDAATRYGWKYYDGTGDGNGPYNDGTFVGSSNIVSIFVYDPTGNNYLVFGTNDGRIGYYNGTSWVAYNSGTDIDNNATAMGTYAINAIFSPAGSATELIISGDNGRVASYDSTNWKNYDGTGSGTGIYSDGTFINNDVIIDAFNYSDGTNSFYTFIGNTNIASYDVTNSAFISYDDTCNIITNNNPLLGAATNINVAIPYDDGSNVNNIIFAGGSGRIAAMDDILHNVGAVRFYTYDGTNLNYYQSIIGSIANDYFGAAVGMSGTTAAVATRGEDDGIKVYIYDKSGGTWSETASFMESEAGLYATDLEMNISMTNTRVAVSHMRKTTGIGYVYVYELDGTWSRINKIDNIDSIADPTGAWSQHNKFTTSVFKYGIVYGNEYFVVINGTTGVFYAKNPAGSWTGTGDLSAGGLYSIIYENGYFVVGSNSGRVITSTDPTGTWTENTNTLFDGDVISIAYGNSYWVLCTDAGTFYTTTDPTAAWTSQGTVNISYELVYENGYFIAGGDSSKIFVPNTPNDPTTTWNEIQALDGNVVSLTYGDSYYIAGTEANSVYTATDPTGTWTQRQTFSATVNDLIYKNNYFVAVTDGDYIYTATDPTDTWTQNTSGLISSIKKVIFGNDRFVAIAFENTIYTNDPVLNDHTAYDIELFGNYLAIGYPYYEDATPERVGGVLIYEYNAGSYVYSTTIEGTTLNEMFGNSLASNTNSLFVGSSGGNVYMYDNTLNLTDNSTTSFSTDLEVIANDDFSGAVQYQEDLYLYTTDTLSISDTFLGEASKNSNFGYSISMNNSYIIIGGPNYEDTSLNAIGYIKVMDTATWSDTFIKYGDIIDNFGKSVYMNSNNQSVATGPSWNSNNGIVRIYDISGNLIGEFYGRYATGTYGSSVILLLNNVIVGNDGGYFKSEFFGNSVKKYYDGTGSGTGAYKDGMMGREDIVTSAVNAKGYMIFATKTGYISAFNLENGTAIAYDSGNYASYDGIF